MTPNYAVHGIHNIHSLLGMRKYTDHRYYGVYCTGGFDELEDYGAGLLDVAITCLHIGSSGWGVQLTIGTIDDGVQLTIGTIDDGLWQAWDVHTDYGEAEAIARVQELADAFISFMGRIRTLPTEKVLNEFLMPLAMWGQYTG